MVKNNTIPPSDEDDENQSLGKKLFNRTLKHARNAADFASDTTRDVVGVMGVATDAALNAIDAVTTTTARGVAGVTSFTSEAVRGVVSETSETAREVALAMARTFLGKTTLTLYLPEIVLNNQIRKRIDKNTDIDQITVECGHDRFKIVIEGHYRRALYTLKLDFNVLECKIGQEKFLRLRQVEESLDLRLRNANMLTNWAARKISSKAFDLVNSLPIPSLINHIIRDVPGIKQEDHRLWYIDLEKAGFIDFLDNRSWMLEKMLSLSDFSILPGLNILRESKELMQQLVDQFEIRGLNVQPGRLEVQVGISQND